MVDCFEELKEKGSIFCDYKAVPKGYVDNYYNLVVAIMRTDKIQKNSIIFRELHKSILSLDKREIKIITLKFGLDDKKAMTLKAISEKYNVTLERIRQIVSKILRKLAGRKSDFFVQQRLEILRNQKEKIDEQIKYLEKTITTPDPVEITIYDFDFSARAFNCLLKHGITTYEELLSMTPFEIINMKNAGVKTANEIWEKLYGERFPFWQTS